MDNYLNDDNQLNHSLKQLPSNVQSLYCPARIEAILDVCRNLFKCKDVLTFI